MRSKSPAAVSGTCDSASPCGTVRVCEPGMEQMTNHVPGVVGAQAQVHRRPFWARTHGGVTLSLFKPHPEPSGEKLVLIWIFTDFDFLFDFLYVRPRNLILSAQTGSWPLRGQGLEINVTRMPSIN